MPGLFDFSGPAVANDLGDITDYQVGTGEWVSRTLEGTEDTNPITRISRMARSFSENMAAIAGGSEWVDQQTAQKEIAARGLDLKVPTSGITRYDLDLLQYLKQREIRQQTTFERPHSLFTSAAGVGAMIAGSALDPLNVASAFIPVVSEARYAQWLARAGTGAFARAGVRAGAGALEGAAGAAILEPINIAGSQSEQRDYGLMDSFLNVTVGSVMGGGLHMLGGAVGDWRGAKAGKGIDALIAHIRRDELADTPEIVQRDAFFQAVQSLENDKPVLVDDVIAAGKRQTTREPSPGMPEGSLARAAQDLAGRSITDLERAAARQEFVNGGGKVGEFGPIFDVSPHNWADVVRTLSEAQDGEVHGALHHPDVGPIDVVWGRAGEGYSDGLGLAKIVKYHADVVDDLPAFVAQLPVKSKSANRVILESKDAKALVRLDFDSKDKTWLLTAYNKSGGEGNALRPADYRQAGPRDQGAVPPAQGTANIGQEGSISNKSAVPRNLGEFIEQAKSDRTTEAFNRQFADMTEGPGTRPEPKDELQSALSEAEASNDVIDDLRSEGRLTKEDTVVLEKLDHYARKAEVRAKAAEAAAACMVSA